MLHKREISPGDFERYRLLVTVNFRFRFAKHAHCRTVKSNRSHPTSHT